MLENVDKLKEVKDVVLDTPVYFLQLLASIKLVTNLLLFLYVYPNDVNAKIIDFWIE